MKKDEIRRHIRAQKALLTAVDKIKAAAEVFEKLENSAAFTVAEKVLLYHSLPDELSTREFLAKWGTRKNFFLPRVNGVNLDILPYEESKLHLGAFQIEEPVGDEVVPVGQIDLIIVPAVAYDRSGNRLGRGKGFYDRLLSQTSATKIGVGYDFQLVDEIETEPHDIPVDIVITQSHHLVIRRKKQ